jgi:hypothetical protein
LTLLVGASEVLDQLSEDRAVKDFMFVVNNLLRRLHFFVKVLAAQYHQVP